MLPVFAWIGGFGAALVMILSLVAAMIVGVYVLSYAAHSLVTVVEGTATGNDAVAWPDEPIVDWIVRGIFLGALLMVWLGPSAIASRALGDVWLPDNGGLRFLILAVPGLWLFFPVGLLSSLSASSKWFMFRPATVAVMLRAFPSTLMFYFLTAFLAAGAGAMWYFGVTRTHFGVIALAGPLLAAALLLYARLLGRLSLMIHRRNPTKAERETKPKKRKKRLAADARARAVADAGTGWDPIEDAPVELEENDAPVETQQEARREERRPMTSDPDLDLPAPLALEDAAARAGAIRKADADDEFPLQPLERNEEAEKRWKDEADDGPANPYAVSGEPVAGAPLFHPVEDFDMDEMGPQVPEEKRTGEGIVTRLDKPRDRSRRQRKMPAPAPVGPRWVWWQGVYNFPFYPTSLGAWAWLSLGFTVFGLCCGLVVANYPSGG